MIQLAADVGSFNNADPAEVIEAMGAALRGESEPMRRFGVLIDEAAIKTKGLELGVDASKTAIDKAGRAQAIYALMIEQTSAAQGDFARTSDGLANQQRINAARLEDAMTRLGEKLKPIAEAILPMLADAVIGLVDGITQVADGIGEWVQDNQDLVDTLVDTARIIGDVLIKGLKILGEIVGELGYRLGGLIGLFIDLGGAIIDFGATLIKLLSGDFQGAADQADLMVGRLQSFGENVLRTLGDTGQRTADQIEISAREASQAAIRASDESEARTQAAWTTAATQASTGGAAIARSATVGTGQGLTSGTPDVERAADAMGSVIPAGVDAGRKDAVEIAQATPGDIAQGIRSRRDAVTSAMDQLKDDMKNAIAPAKEIAQLEGQLASERLARGLKSRDEVVRNQAQATRDLILDRLAELKEGAYDQGAGFVDRFTAAIRAGNKQVQAAITYSFGRNLAGASPPPEGPLHHIDRWAENVADAYVEPFTKRLRASLVQNLGPDVARLTGAPSSRLTGGGGGITVNVYAGVGDPVAIGREVRAALTAYERASGTEA